MDKLKPCPFCGINAASLEVKCPVYGETGAYVICHHCGTRTKIFGVTEFIDTGNGISTPVTEEGIKRGVHTAVNAWNRRSNR